MGFQALGSPPSLLSESGIELDKDYPSPCIDHAFGRQRALAALASLKTA